MIKTFLVGKSMVALLNKKISFKKYSFFSSATELKDLHISVYYHDLEFFKFKIGKLAVFKPIGLGESYLL